MKPFIALAGLIFLIACTSNSDQSGNSDSSAIAPQDTLTTYSPVDSSTEFLDTFSSNLQPWLEQTTRNAQVRLKNFKYAENWVDDSLLITKQNFEKDFLKAYESVLVYSPDEKKVLDLGSYGSISSKSKTGKTRIQQGGPDTEVAVIDINAKKRRRIFFSGPGNSVEKGFWMNDSTVVLAGKSNAENAEIPMLWLIALSDTSNHITRYEYTLR